MYQLTEVLEVGFSWGRGKKTVDSQPVDASRFDEVVELKNNSSREKVTVEAVDHRP